MGVALKASGYDAPMGMERVLRWWRSPIFLLAVVAGLLALVVQSGELGSADTQHRMQTSHSLWTAEPQVFPNEYPEFGLRGRHGELESWYGIGQSLIALPADGVGTFLERLSVFTEYDGTDPSVRNIVISVSMNVLLEVLTALVCFAFLRQLEFSLGEAVAGVLALLLATTHLHYTQNMMENNYIFLLTLAGFRYQFEWARTGNWKAMLVGSGAFGLNLLTRLTTGLDLMAGALFLLLLLQFDGTSGTELWRRARTYFATALPVYGLFGLVDRIYQYRRFGSVFNTYVTIFGEQARQRNPALPAKYPFETPFHVGFFGALFQPEKSIFLFDPLVVLMGIMTIVCWRRFSPAVKAYVIATMLLVVGYISFYARYTVWSGDFAWGDRYVETAAQFAALLAVPLLARYGQVMGVMARTIGWALVAVSLIVQVASVAFWCPLEIYQMQTLGHPTFVIALRIENIVTFALGRPGAWGLTHAVMAADPWDYAHITTWNFLPCLLHRVGVAPGWVVRLFQGIWAVALVGLVGTMWRLRQVVRKTDAPRSLRRDLGRL